MLIEYGYRGSYGGSAAWTKSRKSFCQIIHGNKISFCKWKAKNSKKIHETKDFEPNPKITRCLTSIDLSVDTTFYTCFVSSFISLQQKTESWKYLHIWPILPDLTCSKGRAISLFSLRMMKIARGSKISGEESFLSLKSSRFGSVPVKFTEHFERNRMDTSCSSFGVHVFTCDAKFWSSE